MKKIFSTLFVSLGLVAVATAQDPNFSQFFSSPLTLNPALTGKFDGSYRVAGNYRNQWPTINNAFVTKTASIDFGVMKNKIADIDQMGIGFLGVTDRAGDGVLVTNYAGISISYHKGLDENGYHQIGAGFQGAYTNKRLDVTKVYFEDELTPLGFIPGTTGEVFANKQINVSYMDVNAGILYNGTTNGYNNFYIGACRADWRRVFSPTTRPTTRPGSRPPCPAWRGRRRSRGPRPGAGPSRRTYRGRRSTGRGRSRC